MMRVRTFARTASEMLRHRYLSFAFRIAAGSVFIVSGAGKVHEGAAFVDQVAEYELLPDAMVRVYGTALPWVEIAVGAFLLLGLVSRLSSGVGALTVFSFIIANSVVLYRGLNMDCPCFGDVAVLQTRDALIVDCVLLIMAIQILVHKGDFLNLGSMLLRRRASEPARD